MMPPSRSRILGVLSLLLALLGCRLIDRLRGDDTPSKPTVPAPPAALTFTESDPRERALAATTALLDEKQRLAAWLGIYDAVGIPVLDVNGNAIGKTAADLPGPRFWQVWLASGLSRRGTGIPLSDVARVLQVGAPSPEDPAAFAAELLADLRDAARSEDKALRFFGEVVRARIRSGRSHVDILDPKTDTSAVVDLPTTALIAWAVERALLVRLLAPKSGTTGALEPPPRTESPARAPTSFEWIPTAHAAEGGFKCSELLGDKDATSWSKGILKLIAGGGKVKLANSNESVGFEKTMERLSKALGTSPDDAKKIGKFTSAANAITSLLSLAAMIDALEMRIDSTPDKLERSKKTSQGKEQKHHIQIVFDTQGRVDGNQMKACIASFALNALGVSLKFPENGKALAKVGVKIGEGVGFDRVMFGDYKQRSQKTDDKGFVDLTIIGRGQARDLPDTAKPYEAEYSFYTDAQVEPDDLSSIGNMFWGSFKAVANPSGAGAVAPVVQLLKVLHWSLGEQSFVVIDWKPPGWSVKGSKDEAVFSGQICDLEKPFEVKIGGTPRGVMLYKPNKHYPGSGGMYAYSGSWAAGSISGRGDYTFRGDPWSKLEIVQTGNGCVTHPMGTNCTDGIEILTLTPTDSCTP